MNRRELMKAGGYAVAGVLSAYGAKNRYDKIEPLKESRERVDESVLKTQLHEIDIYRAEIADDTEYYDQVKADHEMMIEEQREIIAQYTSRGGIEGTEDAFTLSLIGGLTSLYCVNRVIEIFHARKG